MTAGTSDCRIEFWEVVEPSGNTQKYDIKGDSKMKILKGLDTKPSTIEDEITEAQRDTIPTFRRCFKILVGNCIPKPQTDEAVDLWQIGLKLKQEGDVPIEDAQYKLLLSKSKENPTQFTAHILGQMIELLNEAGKANTPPA